MLTYPIGLLVPKSSDIPTNGLINHWPCHSNLNDAKGSQDWLISGSLSYRNNRKGESNYALDCVDASNYAYFSSDYDIGTVFSLSYWLYFDTLNAAMILSNAVYWGSYFPTGYLYLRPNESVSTSQALKISPTWEVGVWYHCVVIRNGTTLTGYVSIYGSSLSYIAAVNPFTTNTNQLILNLNKRPTGNPLDGAISDIRIYNRVLTSDEALALFNE